MSADAGAVQQCWLQQGAGQAADGPAVLMDTVQHARGGAEFKYQDVVRRKADRAALEVFARTSHSVYSNFNPLGKIQESALNCFTTCILYPVKESFACFLPSHVSADKGKSVCSALVTKARA